MFQKLQIWHYKCIQYAQVELSPLNILIGPNASGKSTLLDVFAFLHDALIEDVEQAIRKRATALKEGSGGEGISVEELELEVKQGLERNGWDRRCEVIALDPELEIWVWSNSPHVPESLGLDSHHLNEVLERFPRNAIGKPVHPKEAMQESPRLARKPRSAAIFRQLASSVSLWGCQDRAFRKLLSTLQTWFPTHAS